MPTLFVVMPVYNEPATLGEAVTRARQAPVPEGWRTQVILTDDGSDESTRACVQSLGETGMAIVSFHAKNRGKGAAIRTGFARALEDARDDDAVVIQDADLEYDSREFARLLEPVRMRAADLVVGNRWAEPSKNLKRRLHRFLNGMLTFASNLVTGLVVRDMECCLKLFSVPALRTILPDLDEERFGIEPQIIAAAARHQLRVREVAVSYNPRGFDEGKKIRMKDGFRVFVVLWRERRRGSRAVHSRA
ncbi:MAG: glycosyltransferase family 2 protein [Limnohabitans sp.]|jgi:glycosyltransferase involved in cell wall biosynthesis|nr:glycosyltransferase family 2 protein [Limnohabitans sp.]